MASLGDLRPEIAPYAEYLFSFLEPYGARVTSVYRSYSDQLELYRNRANNPYPVAPPGQSKHELGLAFDITAPPEILAWAGQVWESWGGRWGGRFTSRPDPIHFEV